MRHNHNRIDCGRAVHISLITSVHITNLTSLNVSSTDLISSALNSREATQFAVAAISQNAVGHAGRVRPRTVNL